MRQQYRRRDVLQAGLALCASAMVPPARGCEFFTSTLRVFHPWTRATGPSAASAVLCMKFDEVTASDRLVRVETPVADGWEVSGAATGSPIASDGSPVVLIPEGRETVLSEEGTHIRLVGLRQPLLIARTYPLNLTFDKGGIVVAKLTVDFLPGLQNRS